MQSLNEYIAGRGDTPRRKELNRILERHEWFTTARRARALVTGENDPALVLPLGFWATVPPDIYAPKDIRTQEPVAEVPATSSSEQIIDRFLAHGGYRIVPSGEPGEGGGAENAPIAPAEQDLDPDLVTEELAEIYRAQGLAGEAKEIYRRLSLRDPEKSIYFAGIISQIDAEKTPETTNN